ncbi:MAG TPA: ABC transporter ATP-binding protein, partial [Euzebya sp.]|nr:ABC transporter ATP-binding protein [Euzebya sp.]
VGLRRGEAKRHIAELAQVLGLTALLQQRAQTLSGGQKRRLHTAAALLHRPPLALLDEPTVGADVETRAMLLRVVRDLADEGTAVVYTTHYLHELEHLGATIAVLEQGRVVARGTQADLVSRFGMDGAELVFDGPPPTLPPTLLDRAVVTSGQESSIVRLSLTDPAQEVARLLPQLHADHARLRAIEIIRPGLEAAYLTLTGRRGAEHDPAEHANAAA